jgi:hypothetical protein
MCIYTLSFIFKKTSIQHKKHLLRGKSVTNQNVSYIYFQNQFWMGEEKITSRVQVNNIKITYNKAMYYVDSLQGT